MPKHHQLSLSPMELNGLGTASPTAPKSIGDWRAIVSKSLGRAGLSQKVAAADLGITESALSKQLAGTEHLSFWRMLNLGPDFWSELVDLICEFHELPPRGLTAQDEADRRLGRAFREAVQQAQR
jgi:hypothetical protein